MRQKHQEQIKWCCLVHRKVRLREQSICGIIIVIEGGECYADEQ